MTKSIVAASGFAACCALAGALAEEVKLPVASGERGSVYVSPNLSSSGDSATAKGGSVGVQRADGSGLQGGVDTTGSRPTYSIDASTGGDVSLTGGVKSDGKSNNGVKAGVTIRY